jgi:hypothetical protein
MNPTPEQLGRAITLTATHMREVERAIRAAVLAERERCAKVAESFIPSGFEGSFGTARDDRARTIADAIRRAD